MKRKIDAVKCEHGDFIEGDDCPRYNETQGDCYMAAFMAYPQETCPCFGGVIPDGEGGWCIECKDIN